MASPLWRDVGKEKAGLESPAFSFYVGSDPQAAAEPAVGTEEIVFSTCEAIW